MIIYDKRAINSLPWIIVTTVSLLLSHYVYMLFLEQNNIQILVSYSTSSGINSESMVLSNHSLKVFNETNEHLFTKRLITTSHNKDIPITSVQLKDFGKDARNRKYYFYCYY